jgi:hypothetical protein
MVREAHAYHANKERRERESAEENEARRLADGRTCSNSRGSGWTALANQSIGNAPLASSPRNPYARKALRPRCSELRTELPRTSPPTASRYPWLPLGIERFPFDLMCASPEPQDCSSR